MRSRSHQIALIALAWFAIVQVAPVRAGLFTHILREAGEAAGKSASHGLSHLGPVGKAAAHLKALAHAPKGALAAHATPEGHWQFVNREGQVFTAGTADEMKRAMPTLVPDAIAGGESRMTLYLSEDSVFQNRAALDQLPNDAELHMVTGSGALPVSRSKIGREIALATQIKPHLTIDLGDRRLFDETVAYLGRPLNRANIRTLAFEHDAAKRLPSAPRMDQDSKLALVDQIAPDSFESALGSLRGQTVLIAGRVSDGQIIFSPSQGADIVRDLAGLSDAARRADVNLVVLHTTAGRQPGHKNWLWQTMDVSGIRDASKSQTYGDFLEKLAEPRGSFRVAAADDGAGRVRISASPANTAPSIADDASGVLGEAVSHVMGEIVTNAVDLHGRDSQAQSEFDARFIPGVPTAIQIPYLVSLICGLLAWPTSRSWFARLWPLPVEPAGAARAAWLRRWLLREPVFFLAFLPLIGFPAVIWQLLVQTWLTITAPFRWLHRRFLQREI